MKYTKLQISLVLLFLTFNSALAQEDNSKSFKHFGIGLLIEQFKYDGSATNIGPSNKIILTYNLNQSFRIESDFGFKFSKDIEDNDRYDRMYIGLGAFWMKPYDPINLYAGLRSEFAKAQWNPGIPEPQMDIRWRIGPTVGIEYVLAERFTIGGEVGLKYILTKRVISPDIYNILPNDSKEFKPDFGLLMRFYF